MTDFPIIMSAPMDGAATIEFRGFDPPRDNRHGLALMDEIIATNATVHVEMMDDKTVYLGITAADGRLWQVYLQGAGRIQVMCENREGFVPTGRSALVAIGDRDGSQ